MSTMIFVNLSVKDLDASKAFWAKLGYTFNAQFSDENAASMVISDTIVAMLMTEARFKDFTHKAITDTSTSTEVLLCLSAESRTAVDELVDGAVGAGATEPAPPRTTASCTAAPSRTSTATPGRSCGWTRRPSRAKPSKPSKPSKPAPRRSRRSVRGTSGPPPPRRPGTAPSPGRSAA